MKTSLFIYLILVFSYLSFGQTAITPLAGDGSEQNPYQIATLGNLYWIRSDSTLWDQNFIQTADINAAATITWFDSTGWKPIGWISRFTFVGTYNGQGHIIDSLFINNSFNTGLFGYCTGLFGYCTGAKIDSLGLTNSKISG